MPANLGLSTYQTNSIKESGSLTIAIIPPSKDWCTAESLYQEAEALYLLKNYNEALSHLENSLFIENTEITAQKNFLAGKLCYKLHDFNKALEYFQRIDIVTFPQFAAAANHSIALCIAKAGRPQGSLLSLLNKSLIVKNGCDYWKRARDIAYFIEKMNTAEHLQQAIFIYKAAFLADNKHTYEEIISHKASKRIIPSNTSEEIIFSLACCQYLLDDFKNAFKSYDLISSSKNKIHLASSLLGKGSTLKKLEKYEDALVLFSKLDASIKLQDRAYEEFIFNIAECLLNTAIHYQNLTLYKAAANFYDLIDKRGSQERIQEINKGLDLIRTARKHFKKQAQAPLVKMDPLPQTKNKTRIKEVFSVLEVLQKNYLQTLPSIAIKKTDHSHQPTKVAQSSPSSTSQQKYSPKAGVRSSGNNLLPLIFKAPPQQLSSPSQVRTSPSYPLKSILKHKTGLQQF